MAQILFKQKLINFLYRLGNMHIKMIFKGFIVPL